MKTYSYSLIILLLGFVVSATAGTLITGPIDPTPQQVVTCTAQNLAEENVEVYVEVRHWQGYIVNSNTVILTPGQALNAVPSNPGFPSYCVFKFAGKRKIRGYGLLYDEGNIQVPVELILEATPR